MNGEPNLKSLAARAPLAGINVLDLTIAWAGPMATRILAALGAVVVKLENPAKLDSWRGYPGSPRERYPDLNPGDSWYNRNAWFNTQNHDKLSLCIDLKAPAAQAVKHQALAWADVVIANFSPGALDRLGLGFESAVAVNPRIIVAEMPAFGNDGPLSHHVGMGQTMEAASGMASLMGYDGDHPSLTGTAFLDPAGGFHGAAAVLTALYLRQLTGEPQYVEVPQVEAALHWIGPQILAHELGSAAPVRANQVTFAAPHGAYRCAGGDEWVAVDVRDQADWSALCDVIGRPDLAQSEAMSTVDDRLRSAGAIRDAVERWSGARSKESAASQLQYRGVRAAPVAHGIDMAHDPHLWSRGFFTALHHQDCGTHIYPGVAVRPGVTACPLGRAAPGLGQHNREVLELFGLPPAHIDQLEAAGVVSTKPRTQPAAAQPSGRAGDARPRPGRPAEVKPPSGDGPFAGLLVVEHSRHPAAAVAGRMLAAMGAQVISVDEADPAGPPSWAAEFDFPPAAVAQLTAGKQLLRRASPATAVGDAVRAVTAKRPDVVLCDTLAEAGAVASQEPGTVAAVVSDFGESGPRRNWRGSEIIHQALCGVMAQSGEADREPLYGISSRLYFGAGVVLFNSIVSRLFARERGRETAGSAVPEPPLEVTVAETAASMGQNEVTTYWYTGTWPRRGRYPGMVGKVRCKDGWVVVFGLGRWDSICHAFQCDELASDARFMLVPDRIANWQLALRLLGRAAESLTREEVVAEAQRRHATVERVNTIDDLLRSAHLAERGFWREPAGAETGPSRALGPMFRLRSRPGWVTAPAHLAPVRAGDLP